MPKKDIGQLGPAPGMANCSLFTDPVETDLPVLSLVGEVDIGSAPRIYALMWQTSSKGAKSIIVNLERLDFMDSSGLQVLLRLREKLRTRKQNVLLVQPKPQIQKLFQLTGFDRLFECFPTNELAKNSLASKLEQ